MATMVHSIKKQPYTILEDYTESMHEWYITNFSFCFDWTKT